LLRSAISFLIQEVLLSEKSVLRSAISDIFQETLLKVMDEYFLGW
jgi:hypothetical protein